MNIYTALPPAISFFLTLLGIYGVRKFFPKWGFLDKPQDYGINDRKPIPYSAGVLFFLVFLLTSILFVEISPIILGVIVAAGFVTLISFLDDRFRLNPFLRLGVQILAALILVYAGVQIQIISNPFSFDLPIRLDQYSFEFFGKEIWILSAIGIVIWIVLMMNVTNWLDGIPGLTSGVSAIAQISIFILATRQFHIVDQSAIIIISSVLAASCLAFLIFDFHPPKILMGDSGSMFLGFMLGALSIIAGGKLATALLIMGFPILDAVWVILRRIISKKSPMKGDLFHFHHRLLRVGLSPRKALILNYVLCIVCAVIALSMKSTFGKFVVFSLLMIAMAAIGTILVSQDKKIGSTR